MDEVRGLLGRDEETGRWLDRLDAVGAPAFEVALPPVDELAAILVDLAVPHEDIDPLVALRPTPARSAALWWLLERCTHALVRSMGGVEPQPAFPPLPEGLGAWRHCFYIFVFLAALPHVRAYHRAHGIPDDISRRTLADLGRNMAVFRWQQGQMGLGSGAWIVRHFRGTIYQLGRLQFERARLDDRTAAGIATAGLPCTPGEPVLAVHIPEFSGPLTPTACDASFHDVRGFFMRHFPKEAYRFATCDSWLLDEQLAEYLPAGSNILRFQRRFRPAYRPEDNDASIQRFVLGRVYPSPEEMPQRTTLHRAIADHLRQGRHWHGGVGWLRL